MPTLANELTLSVIASPGHSGQTWLSMLIGSHSEALSLGEISQIYGKRDVSKCCQLCREGCEFWGGFNRIWKREEDIFSQLATFSGKRILSISKIGEYRKHITCKNLRVKVIRLVRDGRAVTASLLRKYPSRKYEEIVRHWVSASQERDAWASGLPSEDRMILRYEDLLEDTTSSLRKVCDFLRVGFESEMVEYWKIKHHIIDGNLGTLSFVQRHFGLESNPLDTTFYAKQDPLSFKDERWRHELSPYHHYVFQKIGGQLNSQYGYSPTESPSNNFFTARYYVRALRRQVRRLIF